MIGRVLYVKGGNKLRKGFIIIMLIMLLFANGCTKAEAKEYNYFYLGHGKNWIATYSICKVNSLSYDSLTIQYLYDDIAKGKGTEEKIGPIEYELVGNSHELNSTYPQELEGVANFHVGSCFNDELVKVTFDKEMKLTVKWRGKSEVISLERVN